MLHVTWNNFVEDGDVHHCYDASSDARVDGEFHIQLGKYREAKFADIYVTVLSDDRERAANSVYIGRLALT